MDAIARYVIKLLLALIIAVISGCSDLLNSDLDKNSKKTVNITAQIVFDEAAKGPDNTDLDKLKSQFYEILVNTAEAEILAELKDSTNDYFIHKLLLLPSVWQTDEILEHWLGKLSQPSKIIDKMGADKKPLTILAGNSRSVKDDEEAYRQHMIKVLVHYGDAAVVAESDAHEIKLVLAALLAKGDEIALKKVFDGINDTVKNAVFDWLASERAKTIAGSHNKLIDVFKNSLLKSNVSKQMLIDAAQAGNLNMLKFCYDVVVQNRPAIMLPIIANMSAKNGVADRFIHFLAKLLPDAELRSIWNDYLSHVGNIAVQVNLTGSRLTPFELLNQHADSEQRSEIIIQMLPHATNQTLANIAIVDIPKFLTSVREKSDLSQLKRILDLFLTNPAPSVDTTMAWSMAHRTKDKVLEAVRQTGKITLAMLRDEVVKPNPNWRKVLFYVQVLAVDAVKAKQIADIDTNTGHLGVIKLHLAIVKKDQTQESISALRYYLRQLPPDDLLAIRSETDAPIGGKKAIQIIASKPNVADQPLEMAALRLFSNIPIAADAIADAIIDQEP